MKRFVIHVGRGASANSSARVRDCFFVVDDEDAVLVRVSTWHVRKSKGREYIYRYSQGGHHGHPIKENLSTVLMGDSCFHINGNSLDYRRSNLAPTAKGRIRVDTAIENRLRAIFRGINP